MTNLADKLFDIAGRVIVVTGASRGIGEAISEGFSSSGANVYGIGRSVTPNKENTSYKYINCDINDDLEFKRIIADIFSSEGRIDVLVNAAGISLSSDLEEDQTSIFLKTISTNLSSSFKCCETVLPCMEAGGYGSIINVTSIGSLMGFAGNPGYVASKGGLAALTRALAVDFGRNGIRVNNIVPGYFNTKMTQKSYSDPVANKLRSGRTILNRWGEVEELIGAAIFLASPASSYVTGTDLVVDGGWTAKGL